MWSLRKPQLRYYWNCTQEEETIDKSLLLQITINDGRIIASDGINFAYLNYGREMETMMQMKKGLSPDVEIEQVQGSVYSISSFSFKCKKHQTQRDLIVSLESMNIFCISPPSYLEIHSKDKHLLSILTVPEIEEKLQKIELEQKNNEIEELGFFDLMMAHSSVNPSADDLILPSIVNENENEEIKKVDIEEVKPIREQVVLRKIAKIDQKIVKESIEKYDSLKLQPQPWIAVKSLSTKQGTSFSNIEDHEAKSNLKYQQ